MSELTDGLDRIYNRLLTNTPHRVSSMKPGLSQSEIDEMAQCLPSILPSEVCEMYQWHNGGNDCWDFLLENYEFPSLKLAIYLYQEELSQLQQDDTEVAEFFQFRFPLFHNPDSAIFLTVLLYGKNGSPIYIHDIGSSNYELLYHSLTNLILHAAEWYEKSTFVEDGLEFNVEYDDVKWSETKTYDIETYLETKYMAREHILRIANTTRNGWKGSMYKHFIETTSN
ncbi:hypothetical protein [Chamaesiphon sp. VAR_48_metabat_135_sub]|uniref:hypothetical protein n=1 Tax=Chamaesiphon sp. VAR_48_metabat_135_sub TaxID=2964699 RepID=UPI00286A2915|nr:hypothetical protein [Chamaesiphon sp. VAR_48_metabat_135_sub]